MLAKIVKQSVAYNFECRALNNHPWRASVSSHQVQCNIPVLRPYCEKMYTTFLNDVEILTTCGCVFWCSQVVHICPDSLNTTTAFYFVTEYLDVAVFFRLMVCALCMPQYFRTLPGLDQGWTQCPTLDVVLYQVLRISE